MRHTLKIRTDENLLYIQSEGAASLEGLMDITDSIVQQLSTTFISRLICDHRNLEQASNLTGTEITRHAQYQANFPEIIERAKIAILVGNEFTFALSRMWASMVECQGLNVTVSIFYTPEEALAWLSTAQHNTNH